ncbi:MAG: protein Mom [Synergistaceae bacterium]|jgi:hypothetical protein|nr:protein Mom [Synergistaceae bacterium]
MNSRPELKLDWCSREAAKYAVMNWHYSKTVPVSKSNFLGIWENSNFIGTIIYSLGASPSLGKPYGLQLFEFCELTRVAIGNHKTPTSKILSISIRMIRNRYPKIRLMVSFADPFRGHIGTIYQASGWIFTGTSQKEKAVMLPDGGIVDYRRFNGHGFNRRKAIPAGATFIVKPPKLRYLMPLDDEMRKQIEPLRQPYPKRVRSSEADGDHPTVGGAAPTRTLQSQTGEERENMTGKQAVLEAAHE